MQIDKALLRKYRGEIRQVKKIVTEDTWDFMLEHTIAYCSDEFKGELITTKNSRWVTLYHAWWEFIEPRLRDGDQEVWEFLKVEDRHSVYNLLARVARLPRDFYYNNGRRILKAVGAMNERG